MSLISLQLPTTNTLREFGLEYLILLLLLGGISCHLCKKICESYELESYVTFCIVMIAVAFVSVVISDIHDLIIINKDKTLHNAELPSNICTLINKFGHKKCVLCQHEWVVSDGTWSVLECGHCYHKRCLREWELQQKKQTWFSPCKCAICKEWYSLKNKWNIGTQQINELYRKHLDCGYMMTFNLKHCPCHHSISCELIYLCNDVLRSLSLHFEILCFSLLFVIRMVYLICLLCVPSPLVISFCIPSPLVISFYPFGDRIPMKKK
eukprot:287505_1